MYVTEGISTNIKVCVNRSSIIKVGDVSKFLPYLHNPNDIANQPVNLGPHLDVLFVYKNLKNSSEAIPNFYPSPKICLKSIP